MARTGRFQGIRDRAASGQDQPGASSSEAPTDVRDGGQGGQHLRGEAEPCQVDDMAEQDRQGAAGCSTPPGAWCAPEHGDVQGSHQHQNIYAAKSGAHPEWSSRNASCQTPQKLAQRVAREPNHGDRGVGQPVNSQYGH